MCTQGAATLALGVVRPYITGTSRNTTSGGCTAPSATLRPKTSQKAASSRSGIRRPLERPRARTAQLSKKPFECADRQTVAVGTYSTKLRATAENQRQSEHPSVAGQLFSLALPSPNPLREKSSAIPRRRSVPLQERSSSRSEVEGTNLGASVQRLRRLKRVELSLPW